MSSLICDSGPGENVMENENVGHLENLMTMKLVPAAGLWAGTAR
jgi:hypothetical protein